MLDLFLTIACSTAIALLLKVNENRDGDRVLLLCGNYAVAAAVSGFAFWTRDDRVWSVFSLVFGGLLGIVFVTAFYAFSRAVRASGTGMATLAARLSVIVPVVGAIVCFDEQPDWIDSLGFCLAAGTLFLFFASTDQPRGKTRFSGDSFFLIAVLLGIGCADFCMKVFQDVRPQAEKAFFVHMIFTSCFVITSILVLKKKTRFNRTSWALGMVLGVPNLLSTVFLIAALTQLPAFVVFPAVNIGVIVITAVLAALIWKEIPNRMGVAAMGTGILAVLLLSV